MNKVSKGRRFSDERHPSKAEVRRHCAVAIAVTPAFVEIQSFDGVPSLRISG